jgi:hypothetical protein
MLSDANHGRRLGVPLEFVAQFGFFDAHVFEFAGVEYFTTFKTFHEFGIFIAGNDLDTRVLAFIHTRTLVGGWLGRD